MAYVAERKGDPIGVIVLEKSDLPEITHLWIDPINQGKGVGRRLVERIKSVASDLGCRLIRIESDPNAQPFYEQLGAVQVDSISAPVAGEARTLPVLHLALDHAD